MPDHFGDYTSFLEIAFAVNMLFGIWDRLYAKVVEQRDVSLRRYASKFRASAVDADSTVLDAIKRRYEACASRCERAKRCGRLLGIVAAILIAIALLLAGDDAVVGTGGQVLIVLLALPVPFAIGTMFILNALYQCWIWISYRDIVPEDGGCGQYRGQGEEILGY